MAYLKPVNISQQYDYNKFKNTLLRGTRHILPTAFKIIVYQMNTWSSFRLGGMDAYYVLGCLLNAILDLYVRTTVTKQPLSNLFLK